MSTGASASRLPRISLPPGAALVGEGAEWHVATYRNLMLLHVTGHVDLAFLDAALTGHHDALAFEPSGYGLIVLIEPGAKIPGLELRERALRLRKETQHMLRAQSVVLGGEGFFASAMRGVLTGIFSLAQSRVPLTMVARDDEAAEFVVRHACSPATRTEDVVAVMQALREGARR